MARKWMQTYLGLSGPQLEDSASLVLNPVRRKRSKHFVDRCKVIGVLNAAFITSPFQPLRGLQPT